MKTVLLTGLLALNLANARSMHPCSPTVEAMDSQLACRENDKTYMITIKTLMSPSIPQCQGENHYEFHTALVEVYDQKQEKVINKLEIYHNDFTYGLGSYFKSEKNQLDLNDCVSPYHGGFSVSN